MESNPHKRHRSRKILRTLGFRLGDRSGEATSIPPTANDNVGANIMPDAGPADAGSPPSPLSHEASKETEGSPVIMHSEVVETPEMKTSPRHPLLNTSLPDRAGSSLYPDSVLSAGYQVPTTRRSRLLGSLGLAHVSISSTSSQNTLAHGLTGRTSAPEAATDNPQARSSNNGNAPLARDIAPTPSISYILTPLDATNAVSDTSNSTNESTSHPESAGSTTRKLKESLKKLGTYGSLVPPLGDTITRFIAHIDALPTATLIEENSEPVFSKIAEAADRLNGLFSRLGLVPMAVTISQTLKELTDQIELICQTKGSSEKGKTVKQQVDGRFNDQYCQVDSSFRRLWCAIIMSVFESTNDQLPAENERDIESRLEALNPVKEASYNSTESAGLYRTRCAPNTGELILAGLHDWASDPHSARVCWMKGGAGTGKTTIAYTFCELLKASGQLAGSFFCSRLLPQCQDSNRILSTLAYQFARFNPHFRLALGRALNNQSDSGDSSTIVAQFQNLLTGPLSSIKHRIPFGLFVVVIDALDECSNCWFVSYVLKHLSQSLPIKFFVSSRTGVVGQLSISSGASLSIPHQLRSLDRSILSSDVSTYLLSELGPARVRISDIQRLAARASNSFVYAATTVRYILSSNNIASLKIQVIENILGESSESIPSPSRTVDELYTEILSRVIRHSQKESAQIILHSIICAREPLTAEDYYRLLELDSPLQVSSIIAQLHALVHVSHSNGQISVLHSSFLDYMLDQRRSGPFFCDESWHSATLLQHCFRTMERSLRFNICDLQSSFLLDKEVSDLHDRIRDAVPPHLYHACLHWSDYLVRGSNIHEHAVMPSLHGFLKNQLLFWMEVMNLKCCMKTARLMMSSASRWLLRDTTRSDARAIAEDAQRFIDSIISSPVAGSTPHLYVSILALWNRQDPMWTYYGSRAKGLVEIDGAEMTTPAIWMSCDEVDSIAISPDNSQIVSSSNHSAIRVWNAQTGDVLIPPVRGHTNYVRSVAFSPDGNRIASGSHDTTIRIWDARDGKFLVGPFEGHIGPVRSVAFSPDGERIASGSQDCTVRVWDSRSGKALVGPMAGHRLWVSSVAFSPDGNRITSGSNDCSICVWDAHSGRMLVGPFRRLHRILITSVAFSPDGNQIVSGSGDCTIRIWDAYTGSAIGDPLQGHTNWVTSVAFSPCGRYIASGSKDRSIRIWDVKSGSMLSGPLLGHRGDIKSIAFSAGGGCIVSGSEDFSVRIWDASTGAPLSGLFEGEHTAPNNAVTFLHQRGHIASGSDDSTICIWDTRDGRLVTGPLRGHTGSVRSIASSSDGNRIASGSSDCAIHIWDLVHEGYKPVGPLAGHTGTVRSIDFSPSDALIASGADDRTIRIWDATTGHKMFSPLEGHTLAVTSVAFSPQGNYVASGSEDQTVRVWDYMRGQMTIGPLKGHTNWVNSITFSPDGTRIASGSSDCTVRIWDTFTGGMLIRPILGHTRWVNSVSFSPDGTYLVTGSNDCSIRVWDAIDGGFVAGPFLGHIGTVSSVAWSPDNKYIASGSWDCTVRVWSVGDQMFGAKKRDAGWHMDKIGWVLDSDLHRLFWVPPSLQRSLKGRSNTMIMHKKGAFCLKFEKAFLGSSWTRIGFHNPLSS